MQMKTLFRVAVATPLAGALLLSQPAQAASYTITSGTSFFGSSTRTVFAATKCDPEGPAKSLNGTDARFVSVSDFANRTVSVTWRGAAAGGSLRPYLYTHSCGLLLDPGNPNAAGGTFNLRISSAKWLVMEAVGNANISFELTLI